MISIYEVIYIVLNDEKQMSFQPWARYLIVINTLLVVINSSCNFAFYCGDVVFRECLSAISKAGCKHYFGSVGGSRLPGTGGSGSSPRQHGPQKSNNNSFQDGECGEGETKVLNRVTQLRATARSNEKINLGVSVF